MKNNNNNDFLIAMWFLSGGWIWVLSGIFLIGSTLSVFELPFVGVPLAILGGFLYIRGLLNKKPINASFILEILILLVNCIIGFVYISVSA